MDHFPPSPQNTAYPPVAQAAIQSPQPYSSGISYDGDLGHVTKLWLTNLGLFFVTLSFYRFWGRTRMRQYIWSHVSILGHRLEYVGTGKELCIGFLATLPVILSVLFISSFMQNSFAGNGIYFALLALGYFAMYSSLRYRMTRTRWCGIGGNMSKEGYNKFQALAFKRALVNFFTAGVCIPKSSLLKWQYLVRSVSIGDTHAEFHFTMDSLTGIHVGSAILGSLAAFVMTIPVGLVAALFVGAASLTDGEEANVNIEAMGVYIGIATVVFSYGAYFIVRQWYAGALAQKKFSNIHFGSVSISNNFTIGQYMALKLGNVMVLIATLGLGSAYVLHRKANFFARHLVFTGSLEDVMATHGGKQSDMIGEGFMDSFGFDLAFLS